MKKIVYLLFLTVSIIFASVNTYAQDTKVKAASCNKAAAMKSSECPMKAKALASTGDKAECTKKCPMSDSKNCPMAGTRNCPNTDKCTMKSASGKNTNQSKQSPVAEAKVK